MELDETDHNILALLRSDGRMANREIASRLSISESTVRTRLRRFSTEDLVRVVAVADFGVFAFDFMMLIGINVQGRAVEKVAHDLAQIPAVLSCNVLVGRHDIQMIVAVENRAAAAELLSDKIARTAGVHRITTAVIAQVLKYQVDTSGPDPRGALEAFHTAGGTVPKSDQLDSVDLDILRHLWRDARESNQQIADALDVSEGTIRGRIKKMIDERAIRIQAIANMDNLTQPTPTLAFLGLHVDPKEIEKVAATLSELSETGFVAIIMGDYDIAVLLFAEDRTRLSDLFLKRVRAIPGVRGIEASYPIQFAKFDYRFGRVA
jgi:Lrp/AsnC family transcriptional regulator for asnA, asnC and gidA